MHSQMKLNTSPENRNKNQHQTTGVRDRKRPTNVHNKEHDMMLILYLEKGIEWGAVKPLCKTSDDKDDDITEVPSLYQQIHFTLTVHHNPQPVLIISEQLHLYNGMDEELILNSDCYALNFLKQPIWVHASRLETNWTVIYWTSIWTFYFLFGTGVLTTIFCASWIILLVTNTGVR